MATTRQFVVIMYDSRRVTTFQQNPAVVPFRRKDFDLEKEVTVFSFSYSLSYPRHSVGN